MRSIRLTLGLLLAILLVLAAEGPAQATWRLTNSVSTLTGLSTIRDGPATMSQFRAPEAAALSADGSLALIADTGSHTIRKLNIATSTTITLAGSAGLSGNTDGIGSAARFYSPSGVALSTNNTFALIADTGNQIIRKIDMATAQVTTVAGRAGVSGSTDGIGATALFSYPTGIAISADSTFALVADTNNQTIRKIDLVTHMVTTLAGKPGIVGSSNGSGNIARFSSPGGLTLSGNASFALVADRGNSVIRKINIATGVVTTLAGAVQEDGEKDGSTNSDIRFNMPMGVTLSADGGRVLVADTGNSAIRMISLESENLTVTTLTLTAPKSTTPFTFDHPVAVALSADGSRGLVVDNERSTLALIDLEHQTVVLLDVAEVLPTGSLDRLSQPEGVAVNNIGNIALVADTVSQTIRRVDMSTGATAIIAGSLGVNGSNDGIGSEASFAYPSGIALSPDETYVLVSDTFNYTIRKIDLATGTVTTLAGSPGIAGSNDGIGAQAQFAMPQGITISADGTFALVVDGINDTIRKIDLATGTVTTLAGSPGVAGSNDGVGTGAHFNLPSGVALCNQDRYALITDTANNTIRKLDIASLTVTTIAGTAGVVGSTDGSGGLVRFNGPRGISIDHDCSRALVADSYNHTIRVIDLTTNQVATLTGSAEYFGNADGAGTNARFDTPVDVTLAGNGSLALVADTGNSSLRYIGNHYIYIPISLP